MKIALAQISMRLGDIEGICARIESQAVVAHGQGARVLAVPSPLMSGLVPGSLVEEANFEHDLVSALTTLAGRLAVLDVIALVPAVVAFEGASLFEVFMLKEGRVVPVRSLLARRRAGVLDEPWLPPVFDIDGVRIAVTFDALRDISMLPPGCDLVVFFQSNAFDIENEATCGVAAVADGVFAPEVAQKGVWLACMAPVGGYDEVAFTGGSFVMDDAGRVVAAAPCFEEALLVAEVRRGEVQPALETHELPRYQREEWLWEALRLHLRDTVAASGHARAALVLEGDLPSSLAAALAVDALGPRNVVGVLVERGDVFTPAQEVAERERVERVRALARGLGVHVVEHAAVDAARLLDGDAPARDTGRVAARVAGLYLEEAAAAFDACAVASLTKTDVALAAPALAGGYLGEVAPFGDVYLTELEFLARLRGRAGSVLPVELVTLNAVEDRMAQIAAAAMASCQDMGAYAERAAQALAALEPSQVDAILEAHVDHGAAFEDIPLAASMPAAVALVLMLVRAGERARRRLPLAPIVSGRSFAERLWPTALAWSDTGRQGAPALTVEALCEAEAARFAEMGEEHGERVRGEILNVIASLLGLPIGQLEEAGLGEDLINRMRREQNSMPTPPQPHPHQPPQGYQFFSDN